MEEEKSIYWGVKSLPKNRRHPTMMEAVRAGKVSFWGVKTVDSRTLKMLGADKKKGENKLDGIKAEISGIIGTLRKLNKEVVRNISAKEKKKIKDEIAGLEEKKDDLLKQYRSMKNEKDTAVATKKKGKRELKCVKCDQTFSHASSLSRHKKKFH